MIAEGHVGDASSVAACPEGTLGRRGVIALSGAEHIHACAPGGGGRGRGERAAPGSPSPRPLGSPAPVSWGVSAGRGRGDSGRKFLLLRRKHLAEAASF